MNVSPSCLLQVHCEYTEPCHVAAQQCEVGPGVNVVGGTCLLTNIEMSWISAPPGLIRLRRFQKGNCDLLGVSIILRAHTNVLFPEMSEMSLWTGTRTVAGKGPRCAKHFSHVTGHPCGMFE